MEDLYENKILDDLYEIREGFITSYKKKYGELEETKKAEQAEDELVNFMKKFIKDENTMKELFEKINKFEGYALDEMCFWHKPYYKLGFIDGMRLKKEIREGKIIENTSNDSIILQNINEISDYFEECIKLGIDPKEACNWLNVNIIAYMNKNEQNIKDIYLTPEMLKFILDNRMGYV